MKVAVPPDVQSIFRKKAFKQTLKTSDELEATARSVPLIRHFKQMIADARENPEKSLEEHLGTAKAELKEARIQPGFDEVVIQALQDEVIQRLTQAYGVRHPKELNERDEEKVVRSFKIVDGQLIPFAEHLEEYLEGRKVETKSADRMRTAILRFTEGCEFVEDANRQAVRNFIKELSSSRGLSNPTISVHLSALMGYWRYLAEEEIVSEDKVNPFEKAVLPEVNRKVAAEETRLPFEISDIKKATSRHRRTWTPRVGIDLRSCDLHRCTDRRTSEAEDGKRIRHRSKDSERKDTFGKPDGSDT